MKQRQRRQQPVGGRQLHPEREALPGHRVRPVRLHDQLGLAGGTGGRDQHREVVWCGRCRERGASGLGRHRRAVGPVRGHERVHVEGGRPPGPAGRGDDPGQPGVGDDRGRVHLADEPGQLGRRAPRVHRHRDRAHRRQRQPRQQVRRRSGGRQQHEVARPRAGRRQRPGRARYRCRRARERQLTVVAAQPRSLRIALGGGEQQPRDRALVRRPASRRAHAGILVMAVVMT